MRQTTVPGMPKDNFRRRHQQALRGEVHGHIGRLHADVQRLEVDPHRRRRVRQSAGSEGVGCQEKLKSSVHKRDVERRQKGRIAIRRIRVVKPTTATASPCRRASLLNGTFRRIEKNQFAMILASRTRLRQPERQSQLHYRHQRGFAALRIGRRHHNGSAKISPSRQYSRLVER